MEGPIPFESKIFKDIKAKKITDPFDLTTHAIKKIGSSIKSLKIESILDLQILFMQFKKFADNVLNMSISDLCILNIARRLQKVIRDLCEKFNMSFVLNEKSSENVSLTRVDSTINMPLFQLPSLTNNLYDIKPSDLIEIKEELDNEIRQIKSELKDTKENIIKQADENIFPNEVILVYGFSDTLLKFLTV